MERVYLGKAEIRSMNRITIPKPIVDKYNFREGDLLLFEVDEQGNLYLVRSTLKRVPNGGISNAIPSLTPKENNKELGKNV